MSDKTLTTEHTETTKARKEINALTEIVIGSAIEVHRALGPGLLESTYEMCLCRELSLRSILFERQKPIPAVYKGVKLDCGYRADLIVDGRVLLEIKSIEQTSAIHDAQLLSYLKLSGMKVGSLISTYACLCMAFIGKFSARPRKFHCSSVFSVLSVVKYFG
jgi:GxxExxY protein